MPGSFIVNSNNRSGSRSKRGTEVAALLYTLCEATKPSAIDPRVYVTLTGNRAVADHGATTLPSDLA